MSKTYIKQDPIKHVLTRPDMYIGSVKSKLQEEFIVNNNLIVKRNITYPSGLLRIFIEILSNAVDNYKRSLKTKTPCTYIKINIDKSTGKTTIKNDGDFIPIELHKKEKIYNHTLIFGMLLSGSNFDDNELRTVSGRNGIGSKATNIFSKKFVVQASDPSKKQTFEQTWKNNMETASEPTIKESNNVKPYTQITYYPDFKRFDLTEYDDNIISLFAKYVYDTALLTSISKVKIYFNDELVLLSNIKDYASLYDVITDEFLHIKTKDSEVLLTPSNEFQHISFVNGIYTKSGGCHVEAWCEALFRPLVEKYNKAKLNIKDIKNFFRIFVNTTVINPEFSSQEKDKLESPLITAVVKQTDIKKILKWSIVENIENVIKMKEMSKLKKSESKKRGYTKIENYDAANFSGTSKSGDCSLMLCEGLSARTFVVAGICSKQKVLDKQGKNYFGVLPLTGVLLNCRNATISTISKNKVIINIIQAVGLRYNLDYKDDKNFKTLNYGKIILVTDSDVDGIHIGGLILNFFHFLFPSLLQRKEPFIYSMSTPIVRILQKNGDLLFYDENKYKLFAQKTTKKYEHRYYKGLGTFKLTDVKDVFGKMIIKYESDIHTNDIFNKVFHKKFADYRKGWIEAYNPNENTHSLDDKKTSTVSLTITSFLNNELIKFSYSDCKRSIPSLYDGLKDSQRKVIYAAKSLKLTYKKKTMKVAQFAGYIAKTTEYHHGEQNLYDTIIKMANEFVGTNNIPLLYRDGNFGTRLSSGDASSARYIYTKMEELTHLLFREEDDDILEYTYEEGQTYEPKFYVPILPVILINGARGIGTGSSTYVPNFNPMDIINCIKIWLNFKDETLPELVPWYRGFKGSIQYEDNKYTSYGVLKRKEIDDEFVTVTELPVGMYIDTFKEFCENLLVEKYLKKMKNESSTSTVNFTLYEIDEDFTCDINSMKLYSYLHTTNMTLFNENDQLKKYTTHEIINNFCKLRYTYYEKRKIYILNKLENELDILNNKKRFINEIIKGTLIIQNIDEEQIILELEHKKYKTEHDSYNYLLNMHLRTLTRNKVEELSKEINKLEKEIEKIKNTSEKDMWLNEIDEFLIQYKVWLKNINMEN